MIVGIGTDIIELDKLRRYSTKQYFLDKVFTKKEIDYANTNNKVPHLATTFAAKEAIFKALGTGWLDSKEIEIIRNKKGKPKVILKGSLKENLQNKDIMLSLSYSNNYAVAFVIIEK